jgi:hypothetical protein
MEFAEAVIARLGQRPRTEEASELRLPPAVKAERSCPTSGRQAHVCAQTSMRSKALVGVDVFVHWDADTRHELNFSAGARETRLADKALEPRADHQPRRVKVYPNGNPRPSAPTTGAAASWVKATSTTGNPT